MEQSDKFIHFTATGWTAIGSIVSAISILALSIFNWFYLVAARRSTVAAEESASAAKHQAEAAEASLELLRDQLALTQRPFVAIHSEYCEDINASLVYAHNQGNGPALDVEVVLIFEGEDANMREAAYSIGCLAIDGKFQFLIGASSLDLVRAVIWYKSIAEVQWTTDVAMSGGSPDQTDVARGHLHRDRRYVRLKDANL